MLAFVCRQLNPPPPRGFDCNQILFITKMAAVGGPKNVIRFKKVKMATSL